MVVIDIQVSRWKAKVKSQAYSWYVGEGGHLCFTNIFISYLRRVPRRSTKQLHSN